MPLALFLKAKRIEMRTRKDGVVQRYHVGSEEEIGEVQRQQGHVETTHSKILRAHAEHGAALLAPNGQPSNLNRAQWVSVRTPNFKQWFGDWELANKPSIEITRITGEELGAERGAGLARAAVQWARKNLQGKKFKNMDTGWDIGIGRKGINKTTSHAAKQDHARSIVAIPGLLHRAVKVATEPNNDTNELATVPWVHHFYAPLQINAREYEAKLVVKETNEGHRFYDHDLFDEISPDELPANAILPKEGAAGGISARPDWSMARVLASVKPEHRPSKVVDANGEPLVVYHGTGGKDSGFSGFLTPAWFNTSPEYASEAGNWSEDAGQNVMPVYLSIRKPYRIDGDKQDADIVLEAQREDLQERGYDGIFVRYESGENDWIAFRPAQIKSAVGNIGTFRTDIEHLNKALPSPDKTSVYRDAIRHKLADLAVLQHRIDKTDTKIREAAEHRLSAVQREIDSVRPRSWTDPGAADRYRELVLERGHLKRLLGS